MVETIYIEEAVADHPRTVEILRRFPHARRIPCQRFGEVFNRKSQNFRLQKRRPSLILAKKHGELVMPAPPGYGVGGDRHYYFSHMLNCVYDCRYCFLQGMFRSAHYVVFVNFEDFAAAIEHKARRHPADETWFFSGYDCDSLVFESITHFTDFILPHIRTLSNAWIELRTKSTQIRSLLQMQPTPRCVVAFSLTPEQIAQRLEHKTPSVAKRLNAMKRLQERGWPIGLRFDPLIYTDDYASQYTRLFDQTFAKLCADDVHSVSLGTFRLPKRFFQTMSRLYPDEKLFAGPLELTDGMIGYQKELQRAMLAFCTQELLEYIPQDRLFPCTSE